MDSVLPIEHRRSAGKGFTWPPSVPEYVRSWASATGFATLQSNPRTIVMPHSVFSWFTATGSTEFPDPQYKTISFIDADVQTPPADPTTALTKSPPNPPTISPPPSPPPAIPIPSLTQSTFTSTEASTSPSHESTTPSGNPRLGPSETALLQSSTPSLTTIRAPSQGSDGDTVTYSPSSSSEIPPVSTPQSPIAAASRHKNKTASIIAGVLVPLFLLALCATAFIIHKRRRRARDRREWERTHAEIADAVREMHGEVPSAVAPWSMARVDVKAPPDYGGGEKAALFDKHGGEVLSSRSSTSI
ncbi:hypothetical protein R3P38DRAFT_3025266 [Favolaschia claudopus]|uniref:Uncharacterized protein n=1 Tax=Favolaschia claudopus TaxID=2862362 RepID=A0AAW0AFZ7_9AGAR